MTEFKLVQADEPYELEALVNQSLEEGWELNGQLVFDSGRFIQPMVKTSVLNE